MHLRGRPHAIYMYVTYMYIHICMYICIRKYWLHTCIFWYMEVHEGRKKAWWMISSTYAYRGEATCYLYVCFIYMYIHICMYICIRKYLLHTCIFLYMEVHEGRKETWRIMLSTYAHTGEATYYTYVPHMYIRGRTHLICMYIHIYTCISMYICLHNYWLYICIFLYLETYDGHK